MSLIPLSPKEEKATSTPTLFSWRASTSTARSSGPTPRPLAEWGFVMRIADEVWFAHGRVPMSFLRLFATRKAFIYVLEPLAQLIALTCRLRPTISSFVDRVDRQHGGGGRSSQMLRQRPGLWRDPCRLLDERHGHQFNRVASGSAANIADAVLMLTLGPSTTCSRWRASSSFERTQCGAGVRLAGCRSATPWRRFGLRGEALSCCAYRAYPKRTACTFWRFATAA